MTMPRFDSPQVLVVGGGIGGRAAAPALASVGVRVTLPEQAPMLAEPGAGIQPGTNAFKALDWRCGWTAQHGHDAALADTAAIDRRSTQ
jgi:2-polyprenyl-6-methoxyphenol hydroxylase-like FAD-dependent oxidoreductase